jgi:hypothetical protein
MISSFEGDSPWEIYRGVSFLNHWEFTGKLPENLAFETEKEMLLSQFPNTNFQYSYMIHSFVENPGIDKLEIRPKENLFIDGGIPIRLFLWVYSENFDFTANLIFEQEKSGDVVLPIGSLKFQGWRRMEVPLSFPPKNLRLLRSLQIPIRLKGIRFISSPFQKKGPYFFYLDNLYILLDRSGSAYPGSEVKDNWGN